MYFKFLPNIAYPTPEGKTLLTKDIFIRTGFKSPLINNLSLDAYYVNDGETPEILADKIYGNPNYHWIILLVNNIVNPYEEWPRTNAALIDHINTKYGAGNIEGIHHYSIANTDPEIIVDYDAAKVTSGEHVAVTNFDYEVDLNESKRQIFLLKPAFAGEFAKQYRRLVS